MTDARLSEPVEPVPPPQPHPLEYGGLADRQVNARQRRFRLRALAGMGWASAMVAAYGVLLVGGWVGEDELPFTIVIGAMGGLPGLFLLAGCAGTFFPAPWARLTILFACYALVGGSIIQMMAYLAAPSMPAWVAVLGMLAVVAQLGVAAYYLYVFHDDAAIDFYGG